MHHAAYHGLKSHLEKSLAVIRDSESRAHLQPASAADGVQDLSSLLTIICASFHPRLSSLLNTNRASVHPDCVKLLLDSGFSTQFRLREYGLRAMGRNAAYVPTGGTASFWAVFVAHLVSHIGMECGTFSISQSSRINAWRLVNAFDIMELVLRAHPQQDVVLLFCREYKPVIMRLRAFVLLHSPKNMDELLELLPSEDPDPETWPHMKPLMARCREFQDREEGRKAQPEPVVYGEINATFYTYVTSISFRYGTSEIPIAVVSKSEKVEVAGAFGFRV